MKKLSDNTLEELSAMVNCIMFQINRYGHVSEHLPAKIELELDKFRIKIEEELGKRGY